MAYTINKTDGSILATVPDGQKDELSSDITLIGKNYSGFGEILNENLVKMLENFCGVNAPANPLKGEMWFDSSENRLKVYNGVDFATVGSATISPLQPTTLNPGDLWFDSVNEQLYFYDGTNTILIGPQYSKLQGKSGVVIESIIDTFNQTRSVATLYVGGVIVGIFSREGFTPKTAIEGFTGSIVPGFNLGAIVGIKVNGTATNAEMLAGKAASLYLTSDRDTIINGTLNVSSNSIEFGDVPGNGSLIVDSSGNVFFANTANDRDIRILVKKGVVADTAVNIVAASRTIELYGSNVDSVVRAGGSMIVDGDLTVRGTTTTVNSTVMEIVDKNIELAKTANPTDANADGGGVILKGDTDHTIAWSSAGRSWDASEHMNLVSSVSCPEPAFKINGVTVISGTSLGTGITSAPGITSFGVQSELSVDDIYINDNTISTTYPNGDLYLAPNGTGGINCSTKRIKNLGDPVQDGDGVNKHYADFTIKGMPLIFSMDISGLTNADISNYLTTLAPPNSYRLGTEARILCVQYSNGSSLVNLNPNITKNTVSVFMSPSGTSNVIQDFAFSTVTIPGQTLTVTRTVKVFRVQEGIGGNWTWTNISG